MIKLNGQDSSILAHIAQRPEDFAQFMDALSEPAKQVALCLVGKALGPVEAFETARAIGIWAAERRARGGNVGDSADRDPNARAIDRLVR